MDKLNIKLSYIKFIKLIVFRIINKFLKILRW